MGSKSGPRRLGRQAIVLAVFVAVALAGCGGAGVVESANTDLTSTSAASQTTIRPVEQTSSTGAAFDEEGASIALDEWQARLESVCVRSDQTMLSLDPLDEAAWSDGLMEAFEIRIDGLRSLPRPAGYEQEVEELLQQLDAFMTLFEEDGADAAIDELLDPTSATSVALERLTTELGIEDCGQVEVEALTCAQIPERLIVGVLGGAPQPDYKSQLGAEGCLWDAGDDRLAVQTGSLDIYRDALDYFRSEGQSLAGLGDEAYLVDGYSSVIGGSTRGSTLWVVVGDEVYGVGAVVVGEAVDVSLLIPIAAAAFDAG